MPEHVQGSTSELMDWMRGHKAWHDAHDHEASTHHGGGHHEHHRKHGEHVMSAKYSNEVFAPENDEEHGKGAMYPTSHGIGYGGGYGGGGWGGTALGAGVGGLIGSWIGNGWGGRGHGGGGCSCGCGGRCRGGVGGFEATRLDIYENSNTTRQFAVQADLNNRFAGVTAGQFGLQRDIIVGDKDLQRDVLLSAAQTDGKICASTKDLLIQMGLNAREAERCCCELKLLISQNQGHLALQLCQEFGLTRAQMQECCCKLEKELAILSTKQDFAAIEMRTLFKENDLKNENTNLRQTMNLNEKFCKLEKQNQAILTTIKAEGLSARNAAVKAALDTNITNIIATNPTLAPILSTLLAQVGQINTSPVTVDTLTSLSA